MTEQEEGQRGATRVSRYSLLAKLTLSTVHSHLLLSPAALIPHPGDFNIGVQVILLVSTCHHKNTFVCSKYAMKWCNILQLSLLTVTV